MTSPDSPYLMHGVPPVPPDQNPLVRDLRRRLADESHTICRLERGMYQRERYHAAQLEGWRQVCLDFGITPDSGSLRVRLEALTRQACTCPPWAQEGDRSARCLRMEETP